MENTLTLNGKAISLIKINTNSHLTQKQRALLQLLHKCLKRNEPLSWDLMVKFFVKSVDATYEIKTYGPGLDFTTIKRENKLILKCYKADPYGYHFMYLVKPRIRGWFATNMGSMILKGAILALPVIELK